MRIGTWNVDNQPLTVDRKNMLINQGCNIWLLTEVKPTWIGSDGSIFGFYCHHSEGVMGPNQYWAAILSDKPFEQIRPSKFRKRLECGDSKPPERDA